jgi:hypothetical protein
VEKFVTAGQATDDNIKRRMRLACRISKATNTHSEYVILIAFSLQWLLERTSTVRYIVPVLSSILFLTSTEPVIGNLHAAPYIFLLYGTFEEIFFLTFRKILMTHNASHSNCSLTV